VSLVPETYVRSWPTTVAKILSFVFNPNFCQYFMYLYLRERVTVQVSVMAFVCLFTLPLVGYVVYVRAVLKRKNLYALERNKRYVPFVINILSVVLFVWWVRVSEWNEPESRYIEDFLIYLNIVALTVTAFWRISIHMIAAAASLALIIFGTRVQSVADSNLLLNVVLSVLLLGIGWSRFYLKGHTVPQIIAGMLMGLMATLVFWQFWSG
jgi:membrane-associated phospholipid phosphatase